MSTDIDKIEVLYIRRALNPKDRWSGHVAFPGGKGLPGETDLEIATRETLEETGLDLEQFGVSFLGQLNDGSAYVDNLVVSTCVYAKSISAQYSPKIDKGEISDVFWVDIALIANASPYLSPVKVPVVNMIPFIKENSFTHRVMKYFQCDHLLFPSIYLNRGRPDELVGKIRCGEDYVIWGMTLRISSEFLEAVGYKPFPIAPKNWLGRLAMAVIYLWR